MAPTHQQYYFRPGRALPRSHKTAFKHLWNKVRRDGLAHFRSKWKTISGYRATASVLGSGCPRDDKDTICSRSEDL